MKLSEKMNLLDVKTEIYFDKVTKPSKSGNLRSKINYQNFLKLGNDFIEKHLTAFQELAKLI